MEIMVCIHTSLTGLFNSVSMFRYLDVNPVMESAQSLGLSQGE